MARNNQAKRELKLAELEMERQAVIEKLNAIDKEIQNTSENVIPLSPGDQIKSVFDYTQWDTHANKINAIQRFSGVLAGPYADTQSTIEKVLMFGNDIDATDAMIKLRADNNSKTITEIILHKDRSERE